jgi:hypothetical protein
MKTVEGRIWCSYAAQAQNHRERAARFRRYADEASNPSSREMYLRVADAEENLAATAERLRKQVRVGLEGSESAWSLQEKYSV